jgi:5'-nucleotidase (lipoprotein e(P4) family)
MLLSPRSIRVVGLALTTLLFAVTSLPAQTPDPENKQVKYVRDSEEYATLTRQVYRQALAAVTANTRTRMAGPWVVVLDIDETVLDNSTYELDRSTYGLTFEPRSWNAWVERGEAGMVPGVLGFISGVRRLGGRIAFITNRDEATRAATIENLRRFNLWEEVDRLCLATDSTYTKRVRRTEVTEGRGNCAWAGTPAPVIVYVGDQLGDFPGAGETDADVGTDDAFGRRYFLLPNPMYGSWTSRVTRRR